LAGLSLFPVDSISFALSASSFFAKVRLEKSSFLHPLWAFSRQQGY
jgi:hypothetical protein